MSGEQTLLNNGQFVLQEEQEQALKIVEEWELISKAERYELSEAELGIYERIKEMIRDFWYT